MKSILILLKKPWWSLHGVSKVAAELAAELAAVPVGVLSAGIVGEAVVELAGEGTFVLVFQV